MSSFVRRVNVVLLCEDLQHEVFVRRFLKAQKIEVEPRVVRCSAGSAEQFVRERYPVELQALRRRHARTFLIVVLDGDRAGVRRRKERLAAACLSAGIDDRALDGSVTILVPTWNVETWLAYLEGVHVDESNSAYPRLAREGDCQRHVVALSAMCAAGNLRHPAPASLADACTEYDRFQARARRT